MQNDPHAVVQFWRDAGPARWFRHDDAFDAEFRDRFLGAHEAAVRGELAAWGDTPEGALALVLLLDQFPRNAFRGTARMYASDALARDAANAALAMEHDVQVEPALQPFFYMPFMHSEDLADLDRCITLMQPLGGDHLRYAQHHRDIVARFGRFPHRNALLGRPGTQEEQRFLAQGGFSG